MTETWNDGNPQLTNQVAADVPDIEENFSYLLAMFGYRVDYSESDQGIAGSGNSVKDLVDSIGTSKHATLFFQHHAADGNTTTYTFSTSETIPSNITIVVQDGARISIASGKTLTINGSLQAGSYQVFTGDGSVAFGLGAVEHVNVLWFETNTAPGTTDMSTAVQNAIDSLSNSGTVYIPAGQYYMGSSVTWTTRNLKIKGDGGVLTYDSDERSSTELQTDQAIYIFDFGDGTLIRGGPVFEDIGFRDTSGAGTGLGAVRIKDNCVRVIFRGVGIADFSGNYGLHIGTDTNGVSDCHIYDIWIRNCKYGIYMYYCFTPFIFGGHIVGNDISSGIGLYLDNTQSVNAYGTAFDDYPTAVKLMGSGGSHYNALTNIRVEGCTTGFDLEKGYANVFLSPKFTGAGITTPFSQDAGATNYDNAVIWPVWASVSASNITDGNAGTTTRFHIFDYAGLQQRVQDFSVQNDATPAVTQWTNVYKTNNNTSTTITDFDNGFEGQRITVIFDDANTTVDFTSSGLRGNAGVDWSPARYDWMECVYDGTDWYCTVHDTTA